MSHNAQFFPIIILIIICHLFISSSLIFSLLIWLLKTDFSCWGWVWIFLFSSFFNGCHVLFELLPGDNNEESKNVHCIAITNPIIARRLKWAVYLSITVVCVCLQKKRGEAEWGVVESESVANISVVSDNKSLMRHKLVLTTDAKCTSIIKASSANDLLTCDLFCIFIDCNYCLYELLIIRLSLSRFLLKFMANCHNWHYVSCHEAIANIIKALGNILTWSMMHKLHKFKLT